MKQSNIFTIFENNKLHIDVDDNVLSDKHHGFYLMSYLTKSSNKGNNRRIYFSLEEKKEYYKEKVKSGYYKYKNCKEARYNLINKNTHESLKLKILRSVHILFNNQKFTKIKTENLLMGFKILIHYLDKNKIKWNSITCIESNIQYNIYDFCINKSERRSLSELFTLLSLKKDDFVKKDNLANTNNITKRTESLPSVVCFQLVSYATKELDHLFENLKIYREWQSEKETLLSQKNILKSLINEFNISGQVVTVYKKILKMSLDLEHLRMLEPFEYKLKEYRLMKKADKIQNSQDKDNVLDYLNDAIVLPKNIKLYSIWLKLIEINYPFDTSLSQNYIELKTFNNNYRSNLAKNFKIEVKDLYKMAVVTIHVTYPLFLLIQLESGKNNEVLFDWKINKMKDGSYTIGNIRKLSIAIEGYKNRSNSGTSSVIISNEAPLKKYIDLYLKYTSEIYNLTKNEYFFQYFNIYANKKDKNPYVLFRQESISNYKLLESNLYLKYDIRDNSNKRISEINHQSIRKSYNYQLYLEGKNRFERQIKNGHKSEQTSLECYENDYNWIADKKIRLGDTLNDIMDNIFNGEISDSETESTSKGLLSDCKNNIEPDYIGFNKLKKNHLCSDWKKCLTQCSKSIVIPKIHGPAIIAWRDYLLELQEEIPFINYQKEGYYYDLVAAERVLEFFSEDELMYALNNSNKYYELVRVELPISFRIKKDAS